MAPVLCVIRCSLLFLYFLLRYVLEATLFNSSLTSQLFDDAYAYSVIDTLAILLNTSDQLLRYLTRNKVLVLAGLVWKPWKTSVFGGYWTIFRIFCRNLDKDTLWYSLSSFITFTRVSTGRGYVEKPGAQLEWSHGVRANVVRITPWMLRLVILRIILYRIQKNERAGISSMESRFVFQEQQASIWSRSQTRMPYLAVDDYPVERGFTVVIPRCYDGDTCYGVDWKYDGKPLPPLFQDLNIRVLGIDAPELRTAKCGLERCLAERARSELEAIVRAGSGRRVQLQDCKHDKYGGRLTCDAISAVNGGSAAEAMIKTGLAVPYYGKKKDASWCDLQPHSERLRSHVDECRWYSDEDDESGWTFSL